MSNRELLTRIAYVGGIFFAVYISFRYLLALVIPFLLGYIVAGWLMPIAKKLTGKLKFPYKFSVALTLIIVIGVFAAIFIWLITSLIEQIRSLVINIPILQNDICDGIKNICGCCEDWFGIKSGSMYSMILTGADYVRDNYVDNIMPFVTEKAWGICMRTISIAIVFMFFILGTWMIMEDYDRIRDEWKRFPVIRTLLPVIMDVRHTVGVYLKTQGIIICIVAAICSAALFIIGNPYALLIGIIIAVFDAFPVVGSGSILIPWALIYIVQGRLYDAGIIAAAYLLSLITREMMESRIMGHRTGLSPIYMLASFYIGIQLYGVAGVILGPIGMVLALSLCRQLL